jgi:hypothetical protein
MLTLFGRVLLKRDRLRLAYEGEWLEWSRAGRSTTFPTFEEWLTARTETPARSDRSE